MMPFIQPDWPIADNIRSIITTRYAPGDNPQHSIYGAFNLGDHVGDDTLRVKHNRQQLMQYAQLPSAPYWQTQVHGTQVQVLGKTNFPEADACYTNQANKVCAIMTADCLPVLLADVQGKEVAAVHAGWRGLLAGILEKALSHFISNDVIAYFGPAISQQNYQVGSEIYQTFIQNDENAREAFIYDGDGKYKMDIVALAKQRLQGTKVKDIYGGDLCTYADERFYSYRQACHQGDGRTGRMANLIWLQV